MDTIVCAKNKKSQIKKEKQMKFPEDKIIAEVTMTAKEDEHGNKQTVSFTTDKVSLLDIDKGTIVLNIVGDEGVNITVKFTKPMEDEVEHV